MLSYDNCPESVVNMPDWPTMDGRPFPGAKPVYLLCEKNPVDYVRCAPEIEQHKTDLQKSNEELYAFEFVPTLVSIGLLPALLEIEKVLAWNQTEKHPGAKWKGKSIEWHDAKAVAHIHWAHTGDAVKDKETGCSHRAHAACRLLMSLAHEINKNEICKSND